MDLELSQRQPSKSRKGYRVEMQEHGKAKDALKSAKKDCSTTFGRCTDDDTYREILIEQGFNEDDLRRRDR